MPIQHNGTLMRIYVAESRRYEHRDAYRAVVEALAAAGLAGATVFKGIEGFGSHRTVSSERAVDAWTDLPMLVEVVDTEEKIRAFLPTLEAILDDGLVTLERVQTIVYRTAGEPLDNRAGSD
jgi:PII-like signaling protein